jgi:ribose transport system substrate-binding protein
MKKRWFSKGFFILIIFLLSATFLSAGGQKEGTSEDQVLVAYVELIMNDWTQAYWEAGKEKCEELGYKAINLDPNNDVQKQIDMVKNAIAQGADLMMIQPVDSAALKPVLMEAAEKGVHVYSHFAADPSVGLEHENIHFCVFGQVEAGEMAGQGMVEALDGKGKVGIIGGTPGADNARQRTEGFKNAIEGTDIEVVSEIAASWDRAKAMAAAEDMITQYPDLAGIYSHDDGMAIGITEAIKQAGKTGEIVVTSCSATEGGLQRIKTGEIYSTSDVPTKWFAQAPVEAFHEWKTNGTPLKDLIYRPQLITKDNVEEWEKRFQEGW